MAKTAIISFGVNVSGDGLSQYTAVPTQYTLSNSPVEQYETALSVGNTTIQIPQLPSPSQMVRIVPTSGSGNIFLMQSGDTTGVQVSSTIETWLSLSTLITSFIIRATGSFNVWLYFY